MSKKLKTGYNVLAIFRSGRIRIVYEKTVTKSKAVDCLLNLKRKFIIGTVFTKAKVVRWPDKKAKIK